MKKVNLFDFFIFGHRMTNLRHIKPGKLTTDFSLGSLHQARMILEVVCRKPEDSIIPIKISQPAAKNLLERIQKLLNRLVVTNVGSEIEQQDLSEICWALDKFEVVFGEESPELATFFVSQKSIYSTSSLIGSAENVFSETELTRIPKQAIDDIRWSGRCIAFELATAAGFHALRALEAVTLDYLAKLSVVPKQRDLGEYVRLLKLNKADEKAISVVDELRKLRRNPLMHPSDNLEVGEDIGVFQLSHTAISALVKDMEIRKLYPN